MDLRSTFIDRHIGPNDYQINSMLLELGYKNLNEFIQAVVPKNILINNEIGRVLPVGISESAAIAELRSIANENILIKNFIGGGYVGNITPPVVLRNVLENPAWYTAYTPYQPEISQGRLEAIFAFQTVIADLTGLPVANASMLDEATAAAEAMTLCRRAWQGSDEAIFLVDQDLHQHVKAVISTRAKPLKIEIKEIDTDQCDFTDDFFGAIFAYPSAGGEIKDLKRAVIKVHEKNALAIIDCDLLSLTLIEAPGEFGADVSVGTAQRFGVPVGFGGPHAGFMSVREGLERAMPGRLVGQSIDSHGNTAFRLALQTREQHIRRDKATSNICTAQVLLAVISAFYAMWHGPQGLVQIANQISTRANSLRQDLKSAGYKVGDKPVFDTVKISDVAAEELVGKFLEIEMNIKLINKSEISITFDELTTDDDLKRIYQLLNLKSSQEVVKTATGRGSKFLTHPMFNSYHSETAMLRYIRSLSDRDLALDRTMIPLGSCTMKLNATSEMIPVTWPEFANIHPFAPLDQSRGYKKMIDQLSNWLIEVTGYDAVSLQPNAGSQGEFAGLLAIRNYLDHKGQHHRNICLIPSSAHGTNAASAVMAGMKVVVIECDDLGNVSIVDIKAKITQYQDSLAALMVTYPSTHGVFEEAISEICQLIHEAGGQVYVDGANLNALVGLAKPGKFGADVSHLNLHKTFCIPHGGGGPGVGPVIARAHLGPFLPNHPADPHAGPISGPGAVSSAPYGSASILPISWMYIRMMGGVGLTKATQTAILSANYLAKKLDLFFPILYKGKNNLIAHECIIDIRDITKNTGVTVDDIAKRLMDHGFHAPTVSFPVAGTMMIEPTESEDMRELDRFIAALESIHQEIIDISQGKITIEDSPLRHAPHTMGDLVRDDWDRKYARSKAAFPRGQNHGIGATGKYLPTVGRIDGVHGDRNLICSCLPIEELAIN